MPPWIGLALAKFGHNRDGDNGDPQIVYGLLCNAEGCPVAIEVFAGTTGDPKTLGSQIAKVRTRFDIQRVVFVGDRGAFPFCDLTIAHRPGCVTVHGCSNGRP